MQESLEDCQNTTLITLKRIFREGQNCAPCSKLKEKKLEQKLAHSESLLAQMTPKHKSGNSERVVAVKFVYATTMSGSIFVCSTKRVPSYICARIVSGYGDIEGVAVHSDQG